MQYLTDTRKKFGSDPIVMVMEEVKELEGFEELKVNRPLLHLILKYDSNFITIDNVICAENAFFINSIIKWCNSQRKNGIMSYEHFKSYMLILQRYLKKELDLFWDDGKLYMKKLK